MNTHEDQRRLSAILAADVVGYTRLMEQDTEGTVAAWKIARSGIIDPTISSHQGRIVKHTGDGFLAEFNTVLNALNCALQMQAELASSTLSFRMGINLGDIIDDGIDIHGEGVNLAARIESLADPGGILISNGVYEQVLNRLDCRFDDMGKVDLKNVSRPIQVYRIIMDRVGNSPGNSNPLIPIELRQDNTITISAFDNLSSDPEIGFFCEAIGEDIATALGNIAQLKVVSEKHRAKHGDASRDDNSAHYLLAGKVRAAGNRLRVSAQLVDHQNGEQRWADRFDHDASDLFKAQDDIMRKIVIGIHTELGSGDYLNQWQWGTENLEAWQLMAKGFREFQKFSPDSFARTTAYFEQALASDPEYLAPLVGNGYCYSYLSLITDEETAKAYIDQAQANFTEAISKAPQDVRCYSAKRGIEIALGNYEDAVLAAETALGLEPHNAACRGTLAMTLMSADKPREALAHGNKAALEMTDPPGWLNMVQILSHYLLENPTEALRISRETVARIADFYPGPVLNAALAAELGYDDEAAKMKRQVLTANPHFSSAQFVRSLGLKNKTCRESLLEALKKSGLPG